MAEYTEMDMRKAYEEGFSKGVLWGYKMAEENTISNMHCSKCQEFDCYGCKYAERT